MSDPLPSVFLERLKHIVPSVNYQDVLASFSIERPVSVRINLLKISKDEAIRVLKDNGVKFQAVPWFENALILSEMSVPSHGALDVNKRGLLYRQSLSSMIPVLILDPQPGEHILDFCAAPGSKTTQIAAMMHRQGQIVAVEAIRSRYYKLKAVCDLLGASHVSCKLTDARRFHSHELFDRVLVDAPCSSESRFKTGDAKSVGYWSLRKIKEMVQKQRGLLLSASRFLKPGGVLVYSTCTFAPEENEGVLDWVLKKSDGALSVVPAPRDGIPTYPAVEMWQDKHYNPQVKHALRILPDEIMEGFFIAKLIKN